MDRVLNIVELLNLIFGHLGTADNAQNIFVCKKWSHVALDALWVEVGDFHRLARLLAPVDRESDPDVYNFSRPPTQKDWKIFQTYSKRIRNLCFYSDMSTVDDMDDGSCAKWYPIFDVVARYMNADNKSAADILPRLRTLKWYSYTGDGMADYSTLFMHSHVRAFSFNPPSSQIWTQASLLDEYLRLMSRKMPFLTHLELHVHSSLLLPNIIIDVLEALPDLTSLLIPSFRDPQNLETVIQRISVSLRLAKLVCRRDDIDTVDEIVEPKIWIRTSDNPEQVLSSLAHVELQGVDYGFISSCYPPLTVLSTLRITSRKAEHPEAIEALIRTLSRTSPLLSELDLDIPKLGPLENPIHPDSASGVITFAHLAPLSSFIALKIFKVAAMLPILVDVADIEHMVLAWPLLETFVLNDSPIYPLRGKPLPLEALLPFARHCRHLKQLGLFMCAEERGIPPDSSLVRFVNLQCLHVGLSGVGAEIPMAIFLSKICSSNCAVHATESSPRRTTRHTDIDAVQRVMGWSRVNDLMSALTSIRAQSESIAKSTRSQSTQTESGY